MKYYDHCPACKSANISQIEEIKMQTVLKAMQIPEHIYSGVAENNSQIGEIPDTIYLSRCQNCGLEFANPMFIATGDFYAYMQEDDSYYSDRWEFNHTLRDLPDNANILDIGCGEGRFLELANQRGHQAIGLEFNQTALKKARAKGLQVYSHDLQQISSQVSQKFDAVVFFHVIEHLDNLDQFFYDLSNLVTLGTPLYFSCPSPIRYSQYLEPHLLVGQKEFWDYPPHHQTRWNQKNIDLFLERMGWQLLKYETEPFDWRGVATKLTNNYLVSRGLSLQNLSPLKRKVYILLTMLKLIIPAMKYSGLSLFCKARLVRHN